MMVTWLETIGSSKGWSVLRCLATSLHLPFDPFIEEAYYLIKPPRLTDFSLSFAFFILNFFMIVWMNNLGEGEGEGEKGS